MEAQLKYAHSFPIASISAPNNFHLNWNWLMDRWTTRCTLQCGRNARDMWKTKWKCMKINDGTIKSNSHVVLHRTSLLIVTHTTAARFQFFCSLWMREIEFIRYGFVQCLNYEWQKINGKNFGTREREKSGFNEKMIAGRWTRVRRTYET